MNPNLIADAFTHIDDRYINESHPAAVLAENGRLPRAEGPIRRFLDSGWGAAILSAACALLVLSGIVWMGRHGAQLPDEPGGQLTETDAAGERIPTLTAGAFSFTYRIEAPEGFRRGATVTILTEMTNTSGEVIRAEGPSSESVAHISLYCTIDSAAGTNIDILPMNPATTDEVIHTFSPGETRQGRLRFQIPEDAPYGTYRLELFYPYNPEWAVTFENVFTMTEPAAAPTTPALTLTLDGVEYPLRGGHLFSGSMTRDAGDGLMEAIDMDGMPPETLEDIQRMDGGSIVRYTKGHALKRMKLETIRMDEGTAAWESIKVYDTDGKLVRSGTDSISCGLSDEVYYAVLILKVGGLDYTMGDKTYLVENGLLAVVFRLVSPDYVEETTPDLPLPTECPFTFDFSFFDATPDSTEPLRYTVTQGCSYTLYTAMTNTTDSTVSLPLASTSRQPFVSIYQDLPDGTRYDLIGEIPWEDLEGNLVVEPGQVVPRNYHLTLPADAPTGYYTVKVYFGENPDWGMTFEDALRVVDTQYDPDHPPFLYSPDIDAPNDFARGESFTVTPIMTYMHEDPFTLEECASTDIAPYMMVYCILEDGTEYRLNEIPDSTTDLISHTYRAGDTVTGMTTLVRIPEDAPNGRYYLRIGCVASVKMGYPSDSYDGVWVLFTLGGEDTDAAG